MGSMEKGSLPSTEGGYAQDFLRDFDIRILPLTEKIGHRASIYAEEYSLVHGMRAGDAIIAATATENHLRLVSSNAKRFKPIRDSDLRFFKS